MSTQDRLRASFSALRNDQKVVVAAALGVLVTLLLPWYTKTTIAATPKLETVTQHKLAILVPSFVEASIMLVALAVLGLMFARGARTRFFLPIGDRRLVIAAGIWTFVLIFYRFVDQPHGSTNDHITTSYDLAWGIFFGLIAAAGLVLAGVRLRQDSVAPPAADGSEPPAA